MIEVISLFEPRISRKTLRLKSFFSLVLLIIFIDSQLSLARPLFGQTRRVSISVKVILGTSKAIRCQQRSMQLLSRKIKRLEKTLAKCSIIAVTKRDNMLINVLISSQKTTVSLNNFHVNN